MQNEHWTTILYYSYKRIVCKPFKTQNVSAFQAAATTGIYNQLVTINMSITAWIDTIYHSILVNFWWIYRCDTCCIEGFFLCFSVLSESSSSLSSLFDLLIPFSRKMLSIILIHFNPFFATVFLRRRILRTYSCSRIEEACKGNMPWNMQ